MMVLLPVGCRSYGIDPHEEVVKRVLISTGANLMAWSDSARGRMMVINPWPWLLDMVGRL
jgi:hypothetical protein